MRKLRYFIIVPIVLGGFYLVGPSLEKTELNSDLTEIQFEGQALEDWILTKESKVENLKEDNEARIVWFNDSQKSKTEYAIVYLHGFSASQGEGYPVHQNFAKKFGCNLFLSRLYEHGIYREDALVDMTPEKLVKSAAEAIAIGKQLGEKVILMSTSTGGTLSLYMASNHPEIHSLIMYSPNIAINNPASFLLPRSWGVQIGRLFAGGKNFVYQPENFGDSLYWTQSYRVEAVAYVQQLLDETMKPELFTKVEQPAFMAYYYKNKEEQDQTVRVEAMLGMFEDLGTPADLKVAQAFPETGRHVIACEYKSGDWQGVQQATIDFAMEVLNLKPAE